MRETPLPLTLCPSPPPAPPPRTRVLLFTASWCVACRRCDATLAALRRAGWRVGPGPDAQVRVIDRGPATRPRRSQFAVTAVPTWVRTVDGEEARRVTGPLGPVRRGRPVARPCSVVAASSRRGFGRRARSLGGHDSLGDIGRGGWKPPLRRRTPVAARVSVGGIAPPRSHTRSTAPNGRQHSRRSGGETARGRRSLADCRPPRRPHRSGVRPGPTAERPVGGRRLRGVPRGRGGVALRARGAAEEIGVTGSARSVRGAGTRYAAGVLI